MYVNVSKSHNLIRDLSEMLENGIIPKIYFSLFETAYQTNLLKRALDMLQLPVSGVLLEESLVMLRREDLRDNIIKSSKTWGYPVVSLSDIKEQENVIIIVSNYLKSFHLMVDFFEQHQLKCFLFHYSEIKLSNYRLYVPNEAQWDKTCGTDYYNPHSPGFRIVKNAIIEPPRREIDSGANICFKGGICDENGNFVAGLKRNSKIDRFHFCLYDSYEPENKIEHLAGNYIFGGVLIDIFGHVITDCLTSLWWVVKNKDNQDKIIFLKLFEKIHPVFWKIVEILDIKERIIIVESLCQVDQIIVPDQSFKMYAEYTDEITTVYKAVSSSILKQPFEEKLYKKIYLTKAQFGRHDIFGEEYFEDFYKKRGYEIIAPETLPFETQIRILNHAEEIVCSIGSMSNMLFFANNSKMKITFLIRVNEIGGCLYQLMMNQAFNIRYDIVDVSMNFLPTTHAGGGVFLIGPTRHFINYLNDNNIKYNEDEAQMDWSCLHGYLVSYVNCCNRDGYLYRRIKNLDMFDVIDQMNSVFNGARLDRNKMQTKSKPQLEKEISDLKSSQNDCTVIKSSYYFTGIGWIDDIENLQPIVKSTHMEAIQIHNPYSNCKIECQVKQHQIGWQSGEVKNGSLICGQTGKSLPMTAIRLRVSDGCDKYEILYRTYMKTTGWTRLCSNNEICGSISDEFEDIITGMQIILINHCMDGSIE